MMRATSIGLRWLENLPDVLGQRKFVRKGLRGPQPPCTTGVAKRYSGFVARGIRFLKPSLPQQPVVAPP
ncbi:MAG: hypothetical protein LCH39_12860, partial [Proteobacteria bacterium]|nr:hypothetical protein [Pseudomonadota bacterium]